MERKGPCRTRTVWSGICIRGTLGCDVKHEPRPLRKTVAGEPHLCPGHLCAFCRFRREAMFWELERDMMQAGIWVENHV